MRLTIVAVVAALAVPAYADKKLDEAVAKAEDQFAKGRADEAIKTLQKAVQQSPTPEAHVALARMQEKTGAFDEAAATLGKAAEMASAPAASRVEAHAARAALDLARGTSQDALKHAQEAVKLERSAPALAALARAQARGGDARSAVASAEEAVKANAASGTAQAALSEALLAAGRAAEAEAAARKAVAADPKNAVARVALANALLAQNKAADAITEARQATTDDPKSGEAFATLGLAILAADPKKWNDAIGEAKQGEFVSPKNPVVLVAVGRIFEAANDVQHALGAYQSAAAADPAYAPANVAAVRLQVQYGKPEEALALVQKLVAANPSSGEAQLQLGRLLLRKGDFAGAAAALEKAAELLPTSAEAHARLGTAYQYTGRSPQALAAYKKAVELDPQNLEFPVTYGLLLGMAGQHEAGVAQLQRVTQSATNKSADPWINLGWIYRNMTPPKVDEAVAAYRKALEINPQNEQAALGIGWSYSYGKKWDESVAAFTKAMEIEPKTAAVANNGIAWAYFFKKDLAKAKEHLDKAQAAGGQDARLRETVERVEKLIAAGEAEKSRQAIEQAEGPKDSGPDLATLVSQLRGGTVAQKRRAARELGGLGRQAVPYLAFTLRSEPDRQTREAAVQALAAMGPAAREALPALQEAYAARGTVNAAGATKAELEEEMKEADLRRLIRDAIAKISR